MFLLKGWKRPSWRRIVSVKIARVCWYLPRSFALVKDKFAPNLRVIYSLTQNGLTDKEVLANLTRAEGSIDRAFDEVAFIWN